MSNINLNRAKTFKNDEFYTQLADIEKELSHYKEQFNDKIVYCNCDNPEISNFWKYFNLNFNDLNLRKLIATYFDKDKSSLKFEIIRDKDNIKSAPIKTKLKDNGDFRSPECIELLKECDIVCTNPPFSLFREYVDLLIKYDKQFLIIGSYNAVTYKEIFKLIKDNKIWLGYNKCKNFLTNDNNIESINASWFTNLDIKKCCKTLELSKSYYTNPDYYPKYDNYEAINIDKVKNIPCDYNDMMGVPVTFLEYYNLEQFKILGQTGIIEPDGICIKYKGGRPYINDKRMYSRIFIQKRLSLNEPALPLK